MEPVSFQELGGRKLMMGGEAAWDFGFRRSSQAMTDAAGVVPFQQDEDIEEIPGDRVFLTDYCRKANGGVMPPFSWQITGSCVNSGGQNADTVKIAVDVCRSTLPIVFKIPFTLATYGYSRHLIGDESPGEGSMGDSYARARKEFGRVFIDHPSAPKPKIYKKAFQYTREIELFYSALRNCPRDIRESAAKLTAEYVKIDNADQAEKELRRGRPMTWAGDWGGLMQCELKGSGEFRVLMNRRQGPWNHQQSCLGFMRHPDFGRIFWIQNNWFMLRSGEAESVHGEATLGLPDGGYFISESDFNYQARTGEVRAFKGSVWETDGVIDAGMRI